MTGAIFVKNIIKLYPNIRNCGRFSYNYKNLHYYKNNASGIEKSIVLTHAKNYTINILHEKYSRQKAILEKKKLPVNVDSSTVFSNNELDLRDINVYGFDYDYTLVQYKISVESLIYELGKKSLISKFKYPKKIETLVYNPSYAVRGLHYDIENGYLMKLDQFQQIQLGSIYKGLTPVSNDEVRKTYGSRALASDFVEAHLQGRAKMAHLADLFSIPEMCLLRQVTQFFIDNNLQYHSVSLFNDVKSAIGQIHPEMHRIVGQDVNGYLVKDPQLIDFFRQLKKANKKTFIITNSPFHFVDIGLTYLLGENWQEFFDVVIASAKKPDFFIDRVRPFREFNKDLHWTYWGPVSHLEERKIYLEGNATSLQKMQGWSSQEILYFGDHPYSDLADATLRHLWRTGAIIWELDYEISCLNSSEYKKTVGWLLLLQGLIESCQDVKSEELKMILSKWTEERDALRKITKEMFNPHFGSVFRTYDNPTYFSRRLFRFADVYTSRLSNLINYTTNHTFYPRKGVLPHEYKSLFV